MEVSAGYALLALAALFTAWGFFPELSGVDVQYSDVSFHLSVLALLDRAVKGGQNPLDFWYDGVPYGFALFRAYQYLPYLVMYGFYRLFFEHYSLAQVLIGSTCLLAVLLPCSLFISLRVAGVRILEAGIAALVAVLISDGSEYGMGLQYYTFGTVGIVTQLWALNFLVPAIACAFRYLRDGSCVAGALICGFLTFGSHVVAAVVLLVCMGVFSLWEFVAARRVSGRPLILGGLLAAVTAHQWWFVISDSMVINRSLLEPAWKYDGRGVSYLMRLFWEGGLFDGMRFPIVTLCLLVSLCYGVPYARSITKEPGGAFLSRAPILFVLFFSMCAGREMWGWLFDVLPVMKSLHVHRFALAVHLFGIVTLAMGVGALIRTVSVNVPRFVLSLLVFLLSLTPAVLERATMYRGAEQRHQTLVQLASADADLQRLLPKLSELPYGWTYIGSKSSWQSSLLVAQTIPLDLFTVGAGVPTVGGILFHAFSLAGETLFDFSPENKSHFDLFGIRNIIAPSTWAGVPGFEQIHDFGRFKVWSRDSRMLFVADERFMAKPSYLGATLEARSFVQTFSSFATERASEVTAQVMEDPWLFEGTVRMGRAGSVIAAVGYHPNWEVSIDGMSAKPQWVLPGLTSVSVPRGVHRVSFRYVGSAVKVYLLLLSVALMVGVVLPVRQRLRL